mgnify:FL=1
MRLFLGFVFVIFLKNFANAQELPIGTFPAIGFSLEKNGTPILTNRDLYYHDAHLKISQISDRIFEFTISIYLQKTKNSKTFRDTRVDRYKVVWNGKNRGILINQKTEHSKELSEFLLSNGKLLIKSEISRNGIIETHSYKIE